MQIIENLKVKEKIYTEKLENGLTVIIIPKENIQKKYIIWGTNFGSIDNKFIMPKTGEEINVPDGVAHFLEHKLFEQEDGTNSLDTLSALGISANAYTTNDHTAYLFECTENFYEGLDELMNYVQHPYFTDENVQKEKGIIEQEILMYKDYPSWVVYLNSLKAMYKEHPIQLDIAGSVESLKNIDKEILYKCYNTFYNPSNMAMVVCGDFKPEELIEEIKKRLIKVEKQGDIKRIYKEEPEETDTNYIEEKHEISSPLFVIGIKDTVLTDIDITSKHIAIEIILNMLIGKSSKLYKELYEDGETFAELELSYEWSKKYAYVFISGRSLNPQNILENLKNVIKKYKEQGLDEKHFTRIKHMIYGNYIKEYNNPADISRMFLADYFKGINSFDYIEKYNLVTKEYVEEILNEVFKEDKIVLSVVR